MVHSESQWEASLAGAQASGGAGGAKPGREAQGQTMTVLKAGLWYWQAPGFLAGKQCSGVQETECSRKKSEVTRAHTWAEAKMEKK